MSHLAALHGRAFPGYSLFHEAHLARLYVPIYPPDVYVTERDLILGDVIGSLINSN